MTADSQPIFFLSVILGFVCWGLVARWYLLPLIAPLTFERAVTPLLLFHSFRYVGLSFLVLGVVAPELPLSFARPVGYGDLLASSLALLALAALRFRWGFAVPAVWLFNLVGTVDLLNAFLQGRLANVNPGHLGATYFIPTFVVPALLVTHYAIFTLLLRSGPAATPTRPDAATRRDRPDRPGSAL
jgi:hypothetical protein